MKYIVTTEKDIPIVYLRRTGPYGAENGRLIEQMKELLKQANVFDKNAVLYGIARDNPITTEATLCRYDAAVAQELESLLSGELQKGCIIGGTYCTFTIAHTADAVQDFWESFATILSQAGLVIDTQRLIIEKYPKALVDSGYCMMCVPIL